MYRISYRILVPGWSEKPLVSAHDRIMGTHTLRTPKTALNRIHGREAERDGVLAVGLTASGSLACAALRPGRCLVLCGGWAFGLFFGEL